ncbi:MAG: RecB family exonuclease [Candidatus Baltobacteraceae bacterium]
MHSAERSAFLAAASEYSRTRGEREAARMLRSPFSGVPHEVGAAYAALAVREGPLLGLLIHQRLAASYARDAVLAFTAALQTLGSAPADENAIAQLFRLPPANGETDAPLDDRAFDLAPPAVNEPPAPVTAINARFSASQLNTYVECARKWYYRYVCAAVEDKGSSASFYGTAFHAALEDFHGAYPQPGAADAVELERRATGYINAAFDRHRTFFQTAVEYELQLRRARRTVKRYVEWLVAQARRAPFTVVGCELPAELKLEGYDFIGYIDRLDRDEQSGSVAVIDYKTGSIAGTAAEYREKVRAFKDFQLPFYYWARTEAGDRVSRLALIPLKDALADVRPIELEVVPVPAAVARANSPSGVIPIAELERARARMIELCREITAGSTTAFPVASDPDACTYCAYTLSCADRPHAPETKFAR